MTAERRVLLRLATSRDAAMTGDVLRSAAIEAHGCADMAGLIAEMARGAGALMVAEEALVGPGLADLMATLAAQPPWSDVPVLVLARQGADSRAIAQVMERLPNVTVIERPVRVASLVSAVRSTLRARQRQYELRQLLDGLREADQRKTEFLATLAHELRNPLAPIRTALALLSSRKASPAATARQLDLMRRQVDHMVRLVDDLMEVSRITRGMVSLARIPLRIDAAIDDAVELSRPLVEAAGHALSVEHAGDAAWVIGDGVRLTQVFSNLLNNAAKYTPPGGRLQMRARRDRDEVVVEVTDSGTGLAPEMLAPIFDMFVQVSDTAKAAQGGLGIGLTLVKSLVELHGGRVEASSPGVDRGATFTVRLPFAPDAGDAASAPPEAARAEAPALSRGLLIVDDNRDAADSLTELLGAMGETAVAAYTGEAALRLAATHRFDGAVLDIGMPGMDGCDLARQLRAAPGGTALTLVALTGWGQENDRQRFAAAGFDHHLLKPADPERLLRLLRMPATLVAGQPTLGVSPEAGPPRAGPG